MIQDEWTPAEHTPENNVISEGNQFELGTPEYVLAEFFLLWKKNNYGKMGELLSRYMNGNEQKAFPAKVRTVYKGKNFSNFTVSSVVETSPTMALIIGTLNYYENEQLKSQESTIRMIAETLSGDMALRLAGETVWRIMDIDVSNALNYKKGYGGIYVNDRRNQRQQTLHRNRPGETVAFSLRQNIDGGKQSR